MEVHHHPHVEKKSFKEYILEGIMIFIAVTMGFIAENIREHLADRSKEREYITSMIEDMNNDSAFLTQSIHQLIPFHSKWLDSAIYLLEQPDAEGKDREIYQALFLGTSWTYLFHPTERTLSQLHSEGFHLIKNKKATDIITHLEHIYQINQRSSTGYIEALQNDIDLSAYAFADKQIMHHIGVIAFQDLNKSFAVQLNLSDIPATARINFSNKQAIKDYLEKIKKYSFYLQSAIIGQQIVMLKDINQSKHTLAEEYHLIKK